MSPIYEELQWISLSIHSAITFFIPHSVCSGYLVNPFFSNGLYLGGMTEYVVNIILYLLSGSIWTKELLFTSYLRFQNSFHVVNSWFGG